MKTFLYRDPWERENHDVEADLVRFEPGFVTFWKSAEFGTKVLVLAIPVSHVRWVIELEPEPNA